MKLAGLRRAVVLDATTTRLENDVTVLLHAGNMGAKQGLANVVEASRIAARGGGSHCSSYSWVPAANVPNWRPWAPTACLQIVDPLPSKIIFHRSSCR